jgi:hypothetical protein
VNIISERACHDALWILAALLLTGACAQTAGSLAPLRRHRYDRGCCGSFHIDVRRTRYERCRAQWVENRSLWETDGFARAIPVTTDLGAKAGNAYRPGFVGSSLYVADIPARLRPCQYPAPQAGIHGLHHSAGRGDRLVLDGGKRVSMKPGDVLVQAATTIAGSQSKVTARLLCVTQTGRRVASAG